MAEARRSQSSSDVRWYRVGVIDSHTMELEQTVSIFAPDDIDASDAIRERYPRGRFLVVDARTGEAVDL